MVRQSHPAVAAAESARFARRTRARRMFDRAVRAAVETLEQRLVLASIAGTVWNDRNADGVWQTVTEPALSGRVVYLDANHNGSLDTGEASRITAADGSYAFAGLQANSYEVRGVVAADERITTAAALPYTLTIGATVTGGNFGIAKERWNPAQRLEFPGGQASDGTNSVRVSDNLMVVGQAGGNGNRGEAFVYEKDESGNWTHAARLRASDGVVGDAFGLMVAVEGDLIAVGAPYKTNGGQANAGSIYLFKRTSPGEYTQIQVIPQSAGGSYFGGALALSANTLAVGAEYFNGRGDVFVYDRLANDALSYVGPVGAAYASSGDRFGRGLEIAGDKMYIGAVTNDASGGDSGRVFVFTRQSGTWTNTAELSPPVARVADYFGHAISASGNLVAISAPLRAFGGVAVSGSCFIFRLLPNGSYDYVGEVGAPDAQVNDGLGSTNGVAIVRDFVVFGVAGGSTAGRVYSYRVGADNTVQLDSSLRTGAITVDRFGLSIAANNDQLIVTGSSQTTAGPIAVYRRGLASYLSGATWDDRNADGVYDANESIVTGRTVYIDANDNAVLDTGELSTVTDVRGNYLFDNVPPGVYVIRQVIPTGWKDTLSSTLDYAQRVTLIAGQSATANLGSAKWVGFGTQKLFASDAQAGDWMGWNEMAADGDRAIVSAHLDDDRGADAGAAYIWERNAAGVWVQAAKLTASDARANDSFGAFVDIDGDRAVVGCTYADQDGLTDSGAIYVFERQASGAWAQVAKLTASDAASNDHFGYPVRIKGDRIFASAGDDGDRGPGSGSVYAFQFDGSDWVQTQKITAPDGTAGDGFGRNALAFDGATLLIGAPDDDDRAASAGSAYVYSFVNGSWQFKQKLYALSPSSGDHFGLRGLAVDGDTIVAASPDSDVNGTDSGSVTIFRKASNGVWGSPVTLAATGSNAWFGFSLSLKDDTLAVGGPFAAPSSIRTGAVVMYRRTGGNKWTHIGEYRPHDGSTADGLALGATVAWAGHDVLAGAPYDATRGTQTGAIYVYKSATLGSVAGMVGGAAFEDVNANGTRDAGEGWLANWTAYLDANNNGAKDTGEASVVTAIDGSYVFDDLLPGTYTVRFVQQSGWSQTTPPSVGGYTITLAAGDVRLSQNFGFVHQTTIVSGVSWNDHNADGVRQSEIEPILSGRTVYWDKNDNGLFDVGEPSSVSDASGGWSIGEVIPSPQVFRQVVPAGWSPSRNAAGSTAITVTPAPGRNTAIALGSFANFVGQQTRVTTPSASAASFGQTLAYADAHTLVVGDPNENGGVGAVYVMNIAADGTLSVRQKLTSPSGGAEQFGLRVAVAGSTLLVTSPAARRFSFYELQPSGLYGAPTSVTVTLPPGIWSPFSGTDGGERIGDIVAISGDGRYVAAGVPGYSSSGAQGRGSGAVALLRRTESGWAHFQNIMNWPRDQQFGSGLGFAGQDLIVGQPYTQGDWAWSGAASVFRPNSDGNFAGVQGLGVSGSYWHSVGLYGEQVAASGDYAFVASPIDKDPTTDAGSVYVWKRASDGSWSLVQRLTSDSPVPYEHFGRRIIASKDTLVISAIERDGSAGAAWVYRQTGNGWAFEARLSPSTLTAGAVFGLDAAVGGDRLYVGAPGNAGKGTVHQFDVLPRAYARGTAFQDSDNDGVRDADEIGLANWTVYLDANDNGIKDAGEVSQVTDANGFYEFAGLAPGSYVIRQQNQPLWRQTKPASDQAQRVTLTTGQTAVADFGLYATATVTGKLFADVNADNVRDGSDAALGGWAVFADLNDNRKIDDGEAVAVTGPDGSYTLSYLPVRTLKVDVLGGAAWGISARTVPLTQLLVQSGIDFGSAPAAGQTFGTSGTVAGRAAVDFNGNGLVDAFETEGIGNLRFSLYLDDNDGVFEPGLGDNVVATNLTSNAAGAFSAAGYAFGAYWIKLDESSPGLLGYSLYGRSTVQRVVLGAQQPTSNAGFSILDAYTVTTLDDEIPGSNTPLKLSLREALELVRTDGRDTGVIVFDPTLAGGTITLDGSEGQLTIRGSVSIVAPANGTITIAGGGSQLISVSKGFTLGLNNLVLSGGSAKTGGAISLGFGAALEGKNLLIRNNTATQRGGAIYAAGGATITLADSTLTQNAAVLQGGAIFLSADAEATLDRVTLAGNAVSSATGDGGAIYAAGSAILRQVTLAANTASRYGGGLFVAENSAAELVNTTIAQNTAAGGGGFYLAAGATATMDNSIVADNAKPAGTPDDLAGTVAAGSGHNLVAAGGGGLANGVAGNRTGTPAAPIDAGLLPLADYGGPVQTYALRYDSPAVEAGDNAFAAAVGTTDAAGNARVRDYDGDGTSTIDLGAFEAAPLIVVNTTRDEAVDTDNKLSLREAVALAAARPGLDLIRVGPTLAINGAITLPASLGEIVIDSQIELSGLADIPVTVEGNGVDRVLRVAVTGNAVVKDLTIRTGRASSGAGIDNAGTLTLAGVLLADNTATATGGGVRSTGTLTLANVTIVNNVAGGSGGGVSVEAGAASIINTTVVANRATAAGGIRAAGGVTTLSNTIVAANTDGANTPTHTDVAGAFAGAGSFNFIGTIDGSTGLAGVGTQYGTVAAPADPRLTGLADNGGPTKTVGQLPASPVTDSGSDTLALAAGLSTDARGLPRFKDGNDDGVLRVDKGAFEQQVPLNRAPVLNTLATLKGGVEGRPLSITYDQLLAASDAADPDGSVVKFRIDAVLAGAVAVNGVAAVAGVTLVGPRDSLVWTPPAIDFGADKTKLIAALRLSAWDGQVASTTPVTANVEVTTTAESVNYAVLFSGGDNVSLNYPIYYENLKRTYSALIDNYGLRPADIYVVYADGRSASPDQKGGANSDMSFAQNVVSATRDNFRSTLVSLSQKVDANDHFFFWSFDHGLGTPQQPGVTGEEVVKGWGSSEIIRDNELAVWLQGLQAGQSAATFAVPAGYSGIVAGYTTYAMGQCFAGGMLDNLSTGPTVFGAAGSNHYEATYSDYFIGAFTEALERGYNTTTAAFDYAMNKDGRGKGGVPNGGTWSFNVEHPWSAGGTFPIFATARTLNAGPEIRSAAPLKVAGSATELTITYDQLAAALDAVDPTGQAPAFRFTGIDVGQLLREGVAVSAADVTRSTIAFGQSLIWKRPAGTSGVVNALRVMAVSPDGSTSNVVTLPIRIGEPTSGVIGVTDTATVQGGSVDTLITPLDNDGGNNRRVLRVGRPLHGHVDLDPATGQVRYTPVADYLGDDIFTYVLTDGATVDVAQVKLNVVSYDPAAIAAESRYKLTELPPPPGWAQLPSAWNWTYRQSVPTWTSSRAVDISDDGTVLVRVSRANAADGSINYVGSTNATYRWQAGDMEPYWNSSADGSLNATNTLLMLLPAEDANGNPLMHDGRQILDGIDARSVRNAAVMPNLRYLAPDNANEAGFPSVGGIYYDVGTEDELWQVMPPDIDPVDVSSQASNSPFYYVAANDISTTAASPRRATLWRVSRDTAGNPQSVVTISGTGGRGRSQAYGLSDSGVMIGWQEVAENVFQAFSYDGVQHALGTAAGWAMSAPRAINDNGIVVGFSAATLNNDHAGVATIWNATGTAAALPSLGGSGWGIALDVNDSGTIVGTSNDHAVVWYSGVCYDLNGLVNGLPSGLVLTEATGINASGQIVATGKLNGQTRAYYLDLASALSVINDGVSTSSRRTVQFNVTANDAAARTVAAVDTAGLKGTLDWSPDGQMTYDPAGAFDTLPPGQTATTSFRYTARDNVGGSATATVTVTVKSLSTFYAADWHTTTSGAVVTLSGPPALSTLNLFDGQDAIVEAADVTLVGQAAGAVRGSLHWDAAASTIEFVATGGPLAADTYTITLVGRTDGVAHATLGALDGDANDTAGGNFVRTFTVPSSPAVRSVGLPDFARGPGQPVNVPAAGAGLPVTISDAAGIRAASFDLRYDPTLLNVMAVTLDPSMPAGWQVTVNLATPGHAIVGLYGTVALPAGARTLVRVAAAVPATASYRAGALLNLAGVSLNEGAISAAGDTAVQKVAYLGDVTGNGTYSGLDPSYVARVAVGLDTGFDAYATTDPVIVADTTANGAISMLDASDVAQAAALMTVPNVPALPSPGAPLVVSGVDPVISFAGVPILSPNGTAEAGLTIDDAAGLQAFDLTVRYNANLLTALHATAGTLLGGGWTITTNLLADQGLVVISGYSTTPLAAGGGQLLKLALQAKSVAGTSALDLEGSLNEGGLVLTPMDGQVTVTGQAAKLSAVMIDDGTSQRSRLRSVTLLFDGTLSAASIAPGAFVLTQTSGTVSVWTATVGQVTTPTSGQTAVRVVFGGIKLEGGSLTDGRYTLRVDGSKITDAGGRAVDAAGDGTSGSSRDVPLARIYGDVDGDLGVSINDFNVLAAAFASVSGSPVYRDALDFDGDNGISINDFNAFSTRFGRTL